MQADTLMQIGAYRVATDRAYDRASHMWVLDLAPRRIRCGFDPLGSETAGDIVALSFAPPGTELSRGAEFGSLEAAKFVGPLVTPIAGTLVAHNEAVLANPGLINHDPLGQWMVEIELAAERTPSAELLEDPTAIRAWFATEVERFERQGALAQ